MTERCGKGIWLITIAENLTEPSDSTALAMVLRDELRDDSDSLFAR